VAGITFSGLGSGIDTNAIVTALMKLERAPIDRIEQDKKKLQGREGVVKEMNTLLTALRDKARALYDVNALRGSTATSSDTKVAGASADATAVAGAYNVVVTGLASAHTMATAANPPLTAGDTLEITVGDTTAEVAVQAGDDLAAFADRINASEDAGVSASVVSGKLVLIAKESGTAGAMSLGGSLGTGFGQTQPASDALATVNGVEVTSSGNTIAGAVRGVTLQLSALGSTTVTVAADTAAAEATVKGFVDAYNKLIQNLGNATRYDSATKTAGTLQGDQTFTGLASRLRGIAGSAVTGLAGGAYDSLAQLGITSARDGTLALNTTEFRKALAADPNALRAVFGREGGVVGESAADGIARQLASFADGFSKDVISARLRGFTASTARLDDKVKNLEQLMVIKEARMRQQFQAMEKAVSQFQQQGQDLAARLR
jgi:flagellar hook-associated protein 2